LLGLSACGASNGGAGGGGGHLGDAGGAGGASGSGGAGGAGGMPFLGAVYAHSNDTLYQVNPDTLAVTMVGPFVWPGGASDLMTDIALDRNGNMIGVSFTVVYAVDKMTARTTFLANLTRQFNGLSFIPPTGPDPNGPEKLVGTTLDGSVWQIDPMTGTSTQIGAYGGGLTSSGDLVSVSGFGTVATVKRSEGGPDFLARVDPTTGAATIIGPTGFTDVWGLGFWKGRVYGFVATDQFVLIDPATGAGTLQQTGTVNWWGAGVTTSAPVVP